MVQSFAKTAITKESIHFSIGYSSKKASISPARFWSKFFKLKSTQQLEFGFSFLNHKVERPIVSNSGETTDFFNSPTEISRQSPKGFLVPRCARLYAAPKKSSVHRILRGRDCQTEHHVDFFEEYIHLSPKPPAGNFLSLGPRTRSKFQKLRSIAIQFFNSCRRKMACLKMQKVEVVQTPVAPQKLCYW